MVAAIVFVAHMGAAQFLRASEGTGGKQSSEFRRGLASQNTSRLAAARDVASQRRLLAVPGNVPEGYSKQVEHDLLLELGMAVTGGRLELLSDRFTSFNKENSDPCAGNYNWFGVTCMFKNDGNFYVRGVDFSAAVGLTGTIPASVVNIYFLEALSIDGQALTGTLPYMLPQFLQVCRLNGNKISGTIPSTLTSLMGQVISMKLNDNRLSGTIPDAFLAGIDVFAPRSNAFEVSQEINLSNNRLEGTLPPFVVALATPITLAEILDLSNNLLSGTIPETWARHTDDGPLYTYPSFLKLNNNLLSGTIPLQVLTGPAYSGFNFSCNFLSGTINPAAFQQITKGDWPEIFIFSNNRLSGFLPDDGVYQLATMVSYFDVSKNFISGHIFPSFTERNGWMERLDVSNNKISGYISYDDLYYSFRMLHLDVTNNLFSGTVPMSTFVNDGGSLMFGNFFPSQTMTHFGAAYNALSGTMPQQWEWASLEYLDVSHNRIGGAIPSFDVVTGAAEIYLNHNQFTGVAIPDGCNDGCSARLPSSTRIYAANDNLLTELLDRFDIVGAYNLEELYLHNNQLTGTLDGSSDAYTCRSTLRVMDLSNNLLSGYLPPFIALGMEKLSFAHNLFSGTVPPEYGLGNIKEIYVNDNQLSGALPLAVFETMITDPLLVCYSGQFRRRISQTTSRFLLLSIGHFYNNKFEELSIDFLLSSTPELVELRVENNEIASNLYTFIPFGGTPLKLSTFDAHNNFLTIIGTLQSNIWAFFANLEVLDLGTNQFFGTIYKEMGQSLTSVKTLSLSGNSLTGTIPAEFASLAALERLYLASTGLTGSIPTELGNLQRLEQLDVSSNPDMTGCIPGMFLPSAAVVTFGTAITGDCTTDVVPPLLVCPPPSSVDINPRFAGIDCHPDGLIVIYGTGCPAAAQAFLTPTLSDNSGVAYLSFYPTSFAKDVATTVTWTAVDAAGNVASCSSQLRPVSRAQLVALEVTQSVQDWLHNVPLVAGKSTLVRAFVQMDDNDVRQAQLLLNGYLRAYRADGSALDPIAKVNLESSLRITKTIRAGRGFIRGSFNYLLPFEWVSAGELTLCFVPAPSDEFLGISPVACMEQDAVADCCITVSFQTMYKPCFRFIKVIYKDEDGVQRFVATPVLHEQWRRFRSMLPIPASSTADFRQFDFVYSARPPLRVVNNALDATRVIDNLSQRCWYIGVLRGKGGGLAELNGETAAYYAGSTEGSYSCGYERNRGVHEFLHNMGIEHARQGNFTACSTVPMLDGAQFPFITTLGYGNSTVVRATLGPLNDPLTEVFGTDPQLAATGAPSVLAFSSPRCVFALMSYCQPLNIFGCQSRWIDRTTYTNVMDIINERAPTGPQPLGSDTPADITMFRGSIEINDKGYDVVLGPLLTVCTTADALDKTSGKPTNFSMQVVQDGNITLNVPVKDSTPTADLIDCTDPNDPNCATLGGDTAYGGYPNTFPVGTTPCSFCFGSFDLFSTYSFDFYPMFSFDAAPQFSSDFYPMFSFDGFPFFVFDSNVFLLFDGWPQFGFDAAGLPTANVGLGNTAFLVADFLGFFEEIAANYSDFSGVSNGVAGGVRTIDFKIVQQTAQAGLPLAGQPLPGPVQVQFKFDLDQSVIATFQLSANPPVIENVTKIPEGDVTDETTVILCFYISDPDDDDNVLTSTVQYCPDYDISDLCSCEIFTLDHVDAHTGNNLVPRQVCVEYAKSNLSATSAARFRVYISDGLRSADTVTNLFSVSNNVPDVQIVFPTNGTYSVFGDNLLYLQGYAYDIEDGSLGVNDCTWYEASDGPNLVDLGYGLETSVVTSTLRANYTGNGTEQTCLTTHVIRLECYDWDGNNAMHEITHSLIGSAGAPNITCPVALVEVSGDPFSCSANVTYPLVTAVDACGFTYITPELITPPWAASGATFPVGETTVVYRATESVTHHSASCQFIVSVREQAPPVLTCPPDITVPGQANLGGANVTYTVSVADCALATVGPLNQALSSGSIFPFGSTLVEYAAVDASGNAAQCSFTVEVQQVITCGAECLGVRDPYILEFTLQMTTTGATALDAQEACAWNVVFGTIVGLVDPGDPCVITSSDVAKRRRALLQSTFLRVTRLYFPTEAEANRARDLILAALENGTLLAQLQALFGTLSINAINFLMVLVTGFKSDPHFQGPCGQRFDFMGAPGESFCLMTSGQLHVNGRMMAAMALTAGPEDRAAAAGVAVATVNHTWVQELGILYGNASITIAAASPAGTGFKAQHGRVTVNGVELGSMLAGKALTLDNGLRVERRKTRVKVTLHPTATLMVDIVRASFWEHGHGPGGNFLNLKVLQLAQSTEWHGVLGQTFGQACPTSSSSENGTMAGVAEAFSILNVDQYHTSGILSSDCAVSRFRRPDHG